MLIIMEDRIAQFHSQASANLTGDKLQKEIASLRKFLHKHQNDTLSGPERSNLMSAIERHKGNPAAYLVPGSAASNASSSSKAVSAAGGTADPPILGLLEDALKMPDKIFAKDTKMKLLRWYEDIQAKVAAGSDGSGSGASAASLSVVTMSLIDITRDGFLSLVPCDTDTDDVDAASNSDSGPREDVKCPDDADGAALRKAFDDGKDVSVVISVSAGSRAGVGARTKAAHAAPTVVKWAVADG